MITLVAERTRIVGRLRWHVHELDPGWRPPVQLDRVSAFARINAQIDELAEQVSAAA